MTNLEWALIAAGALVVIAVYIHAQRKAAQQAIWSRKKGREGAEEDQLEFWRDDEGFDEFGVGQVRNSKDKQAPTLGDPIDEAAARVDEPGQPEPSADVQDGDDAGEAEAAPAGRLVVLSVRESEEKIVPGATLHEALQSCGLQYGDHQIYHRHTPRGDAVFSVASMVKPGFLDPEDADALTTPGVSMFMQLPGPLPAEMAMDDLLETANAIAERIGGELLNAQREPLDAEAIEQLRQDVRGL